MKTLSDMKQLNTLTVGDKLYYVEDTTTHRSSFGVTEIVSLGDTYIKYGILYREVSTSNGYVLGIPQALSSDSADVKIGSHDLYVYADKDEFINDMENSPEYRMAKEIIDLHKKVKFY